MTILSERNSAGIEVTLYWNRDDDTTEVWVVTSEETFGMIAPNVQALDVFEHPFAYRNTLESIKTCEVERMLAQYSVLVP